MTFKDLPGSVEVILSGFRASIWNRNAIKKYNEPVSTFFVFVQVCDVRPLIRAHRFRADTVADSFLLTVDLAESTVQILLPVDLITVDLIEKCAFSHDHLKHL